MRKFLPLIIVSFLAILSIGLTSVEASPQSVDTLFVAKQWKALDEYFTVHKDYLSPREWSLYANALWFQSRYAEALDVLLEIQDKFPPSVKPYGEFYMALAFERTNRQEEARALLYKLWPVSPRALRFYVAYGLFRTEENIEKEKWGRAMMSAASDDAQRVQALTALFSIDSAGLEEAFALLDIQPQNSTALNFLKRFPEDIDARIPFYLGYAAFLKGNYKEAEALLKKVDESPPHWHKAYYYRAYSNYRLRNYEEAVTLWHKLATGGRDFALASVERLAMLASKGNAKAMEVLKILAGPDGEVARAALYHLISYYEDIGDEATARALTDRLLSGEDDFYSMKVLWRMGWKAWKNEDHSRAAEHFKRASAYDGDDLWTARTLYWAARAFESAGNTKEAEALLNKLKVNYPLSYYCLLAEEIEGKIIDGLPEEFQSKPSQMEAWGFIFWESRILSQSRDIAARYRSSRLYSWLGNFDLAYNVARPLEYSIKGDGPISRGLLEVLYPTPFEVEVQESCEKFGVDSNVIWAIMRQESAFNPNATSWVGASGLMQLMPATANEEAAKLGIKKFDIYSPETNIRLGVAHFSWLLGRLKDLPLALAAYNAGIGNVTRWLPEEGEFDVTQWIEDIPFNETLTYVRKVIANYKIYKALYGDKT